MPLLTAFLTTAIVFLVADAIMLRSVLQPVFSRHLGDALYEGGFRLLPALLFYVSYMGGVLYFASIPALRADAPSLALLNGAILGFVAYGTYEFTSWAVMRDWHPQIVAMDLAWGTVLTGGAAWAGVMAARAIAG
jgi:uncharacterized membrane protein